MSPQSTFEATATLVMGEGIDFGITNSRNLLRELHDRDLQEIAWVGDRKRTLLLALKEPCVSKEFLEKISSIWKNLKLETTGQSGRIEELAANTIGKNRINVEHHATKIE